MSRGNLNGFAVSFGPEKIGEDASMTSAPWIPRISREVLRHLACQMMRSSSTSVGFGMAIGAVRPNGPAQTR